jgi:hypothetical protein
VSAKRQTGPNAERTALHVVMTRAELEDLVRLARQYEKSMGFSRHFVRFASGPEMRARFRFVAQESDVLEAFARAELEAADSGDSDTRTVDFLPRTLIAFWGRALSSLRSDRSRRRLGRERLATRQAVETKLRDAFAELYRRDTVLARSEIETRREREIAWINEALTS